MSEFDDVADFCAFLVLEVRRAEVRPGSFDLCRELVLDDLIELHVVFDRIVGLGDPQDGFLTDGKIDDAVGDVTVEEQRIRFRQRELDGIQKKILSDNDNDPHLEDLF